MKKSLISLLIAFGFLPAYAQTNQFCIDNGSGYYIHVCTQATSNPGSCTIQAGGITTTYSSSANSVTLYATSLCNAKKKYYEIGTFESNGTIALHVTGMWSNCNQPGAVLIGFPGCNANANSSN